MAILKRVSSVFMLVNFNMKVVLRTQQNSLIMKVQEVSVTLRVKKLSLLPCIPSH